MRLETLGFGPRIASWFEQIRFEEERARQQTRHKPVLQPARVATRFNQNYKVLSAAGELRAEVAGRLRHHAAGAHELPAVGDWVAVRAAGPVATHASSNASSSATMHTIAPRYSVFSRKAAGRGTEEQVVAANVDVVLLVAGLDNDYSARRMERYLAAAWESGAMPGVVLNKADVCTNVATRVAEVSAIAPGVAVHAVSALTGEALDELEAHLGAGRTVALLGSSGTGKSTLINRLMAPDADAKPATQLLATQPVREHDSRGRHTTTRRELMLLPPRAGRERGLIMDTPGMRELQLWNADEGLHVAFDEVEMLARQCRFDDCTHRAEPGCAVRAAIDEGTLSSERLDSFQKMQKELRFLELRGDKWAALEEKKKWKAIHKAQSRFYKG